MTSNQESTKGLNSEKTESPEECTRRLTRRLSEYEAASKDTTGRANQLRKERDVERTINQKLRKEIDKLSNQLLRERTRIASLEKACAAREFDSRKHDKQEETDVENVHLSKRETKAILTQQELTLKVKELKKILEERIKEEGSRQQEENSEGEARNNMAALALLYQSVQSYLGIENESEENEDDADTLAAVDTLVDGLKRNHTYLQENKNHGKSQVSTWMKILVYLGPIFLSALCYLAFTTVKK